MERKEGRESKEKGKEETAWEGREEELKKIRKKSSSAYMFTFH